MQIHRITRSATSYFSEQQVRLTEGQNGLSNYINQPFSMEAFENQIEQKKSNYSSDFRSTLVKSLQNQYVGINLHDAVAKNLSALESENTFTVTTGHQLSLLTGPLYFVIKIIHVIKMAEELNQKYPNQHFVPVYWMATEDHDFEEVQSMNMFHKDLSVEYNQSGAVGRFNIDALDEFKSTIKSFFREEQQAQIVDLLDAYSGSNLTEATRNLVNKLFEEHGLIIVDGDDIELKRNFSGIVKKELIEGFSEKAVIATNSSLEKEDLKIQIHARPINLFYLKDGIRERIQRQGNAFFVEGVGTLSQEEILTELENHPERFSPNVVLRPLYQEVILPNLAYVGGAGEISYWLQLGKVFEEVSIVYPLIQVRNSIIWLDKSVGKKMGQASMELMEIFEDADVLKKRFVTDEAEDALDFSKMENLLTELNEEVMRQILDIEPNLKQYAEAEQTKITKQIENVKAKLIKTSKSKHDGAMKAIDFVKDRLFPANGMQERKYNILHFSADGDVKKTIETLFSAIEPFDNRIAIIDESEGA